MSGNKINFNDKKIKKSDFYNKNKKYGKYNSSKYFDGYNDNDVIRSLCLKLSQMTGYINKFNKNKNTITMSLKVKDKKLKKNKIKYGKKLKH